ncbi:MAG: hypothetical protein M3N14_02285, partial [Bacteroidota bacterium]|nr:hypothetical protein [Bacteroidota bacterium]
VYNEMGQVVKKGLAAEHGHDTANPHTQHYELRYACLCGEQQHCPVGVVAGICAPIGFKHSVRNLKVADEV